ncbi:MAG: Spy/CpxP family protein refolding chaperone [Deltaproteobacteria bacterium]|nr:Spy/CpxP family protein refolding chaperone [Deltaproteobacteria bacterium]
MKKLMTLIAMIALTAAAAFPALADRGVKVGYGNGPGNVADIAAARGLDLTAEQREKINITRASHLKDIQPLQEQIARRSRELKSLWLAATPDREKILTLQKEAQLLRDQLTDKRTAYLLEVRKVLTPEQLVKVRAYVTGRGMAGKDGDSGMAGGHPSGRVMR